MSECRNWETEHYNTHLELTVSFLGIHKWEPDIYIEFSAALHLQSVLLHSDANRKRVTNWYMGAGCLLCFVNSDRPVFGVSQPDVNQ
jgi:hypothetical protein